MILTNDGDWRSEVTSAATDLQCKGAGLSRRTFDTDQRPHIKRSCTGHPCTSGPRVQQSGLACRSDGERCSVTSGTKSSNADRTSTTLG